MGSTTFSGAVTSTNGFTGDVTGNVTGDITGDVTAGTVTASTSVAIGGGTAVTNLLQGTVSVTVSALAANAQEDKDVTVTGAATGDIVTVCPTDAAAEAGLTFCAWVSAADTVTVRITNDTTGSLTGSTANWSYLLTSIA